MCGVGGRKLLESRDTVQEGAKNLLLVWNAFAKLKVCVSSRQQPQAFSYHRWTIAAARRSINLRRKKNSTLEWTLEMKQKKIVNNNYSYIITRKFQMTKQKNNNNREKRENQKNICENHGLARWWGG